MTKVELKNHWFGPDAKLYDPGVQDIPDSIVEALPSSAVLLDEDGKPIVKKEAVKPATK